MTSQNKIEEFNKIYNDTYNDIFKYIVIKCNDINYVNDIIQEVYIELWKKIENDKIENINIKNYLIGISIFKIKKHYKLIDRIKTISLNSKYEEDSELIDIIADDIEVESIVFNNSNLNLVWKYIKNMKNRDVAKIFILHYKFGLTIKEIAINLNKKESYIKNILYRTLRELNNKFGGGEENE